MPTTPPRTVRTVSPDGRMRIHDLRTAEMLVVSVLRLWAEPLRLPEETHPHWQDGLTAAGLVNDAAVAFDTVMRIVVAATTRPLDIHRPPCPTLGADEALLLDMIGLLQQGRHGEAGVLLADWLPLAGVRMAMAPLCILANALQRSGLRMPVVPANPTTNPIGGPATHGRPATGGQKGDFAKARPMAQADRGATLVH